MRNEQNRNQTLHQVQETFEGRWDLSKPELRKICT